MSISKLFYKNFCSVLSILLICLGFGCNNDSNGLKSVSNENDIEYFADSIPNLRSNDTGYRRFYPDKIFESDSLKASVSKRDSSFSVTGHIRKDYRIFGYEQPDTNSKRLILFSVFTRDVDGNPYHCPYGAFYGTNFGNDRKLKFIEEKKDFILTELRIKGQPVSELYFDKNWVEFIED